MKKDKKDAKETPVEACIRLFGSYENALKAAGLEPSVDVKDDIGEELGIF